MGSVLLTHSLAGYKHLVHYLSRKALNTSTVQVRLCVYLKVLLLQRRSFISVNRITSEPLQILDILYLVFFALPSITHVPVESLGIAAYHEEVTAQVLQEPVGHPRGHNYHVTLLHLRFQPLWILLPAETEFCAARRDAEDLVRCAVEVTNAVHRVPPVRDDHANRLEV